MLKFVDSGQLVYRNACLPVLNPTADAAEKPLELIDSDTAICRPTSADRPDSVAARPAMTRGWRWHSAAESNFQPTLARQGRARRNAADSTRNANVRNRLDIEDNLRAAYPIPLVAGYTRVGFRCRSHIMPAKARSPLQRHSSLP